MSLPEVVDPHLDGDGICGLQDRWKISGVLATKIVCMAGRLPFGIQIISGYRTREKQAELERSGRPAAPDHLSTHRACPATGVDLFPLVAVSNVVKATLGEAAVVCGLRWGGGSQVDPESGIPSDWNHVDLGPRSSAP